MFGEDLLKFVLTSTSEEKIGFFSVTVIVSEVAAVLMMPRYMLLHRERLVF